MHAVDIGQDVLSRVLARRGRVHLFDTLDPARCALVVVDTQNTSVGLSDCCAALTDREHQATLETFIQKFGDVMTKDEVLALFERKRN